MEELSIKKNSRALYDPRKGTVSQFREFRNQIVHNNASQLKTELYTASNDFSETLLDHCAYALQRPNIKKRNTILDILPTHGNSLIGLRSRLDTAQLTAFELSTQIKSHIQLKLRCFGLEDKVDFLLADTANQSWQIPSGDGTFSCVTCLDRLNLIPDAPALLSEIYRVLESDGLLIINNVNSFSIEKLTALFRVIKKRQPPTTDYSNIVSVMSMGYGEVLSMLRKTGFKDFTIYGLVPVTASAYRLLARASSWIGDTDRQFRYEYKAASSLSTALPLLTRFAAIILIIAAKEKQ